MNRREYLQASFSVFFAAIIAACTKDTGKYPIVKKLEILNIDPVKAISGYHIKIKWRSENISLVSIYTKTGINNWQIEALDIDAKLNEFVILLTMPFLANDKLSVKIISNDLETIRSNIPTANGFIIDTLVYTDLAVIGAIKSLNIAGNDVFVKRESANSIKCFSSSCTHSGCPISFLQSSNKFNCSCHGSQFDTNGNVLQGPASTPLNTFICETLGAEKFAVLY